MIDLQSKSSVHHIAVQVVGWDVKSKREDEEQRVKNKNKGAQSLLYYYFNIGYYFFLTPFKPIYDSVEDHYVIKSDGCVKLALIITRWSLRWVCNVTVLVTKYHKFFFTGNGDLSAKKYFILVQLGLNSFRDVMFFWMMWRDQRKIETLLNKVNHSSLLKQQWRNREEKASFVKWDRGQIYAILVQVIFFTTLFIRFLSASDGYRSDATSHDFFSTYIANGKRRWLLDPSPQNGTIHSHTVSDSAIGVLEIVLNFASFTNFFFVEVFFYGPISITLLTASLKFEEFIMQISIMDNFNKKALDKVNIQYQIKQKFRELKNLSDAMNGVCAKLTLLTVTNFSLRLIFYLNDSIRQRNLVTLMDFFGRLVFMTISMMIMAEVYRMMSRFRVWLVNEDNQKTYFADKFIPNNMMKEIKTKPIGLGITGMYNLDYGFIAEILTVVITLFLVSFEK